MLFNKLRRIEGPEATFFGRLAKRDIDPPFRRISAPFALNKLTFLKAPLRRVSNGRDKLPFGQEHNPF